MNQTNEYWEIKEKREKTFYVLNGLVANGKTVEEATDLAIKQVEKVFKHFKIPEDIKTPPDILEDIPTKDIFEERAEAEEEQSYQHNPKTSRKPFKGKDDTMMYPVMCNNCSEEAWSPVKGVNTKACKRCR